MPVPPPTELDEWLEDPYRVQEWLSSMGVRDLKQGLRDLTDILNRSGLPRAATHLVTVLDRLLPRCPDPGMALRNLDRFLAGHKRPDAAFPVLELDPRSTEVLLQVFSTSQHFSEQIIKDPGVLAWLRGGGERWLPETLASRLWSDLAASPSDEARMETLRRFRHREMLRIGFNDIVRGMPLEVITQDLSHLAEACVDGACRLAWEHTLQRHSTPRGPDGRPARFAVLALGKLGGEELNYSSDIDLIFLYDADGRTDAPRSIGNAEFFTRLGGELVRTLSDHTAHGSAYRVDMRLRPDGAHGPLVRSLPATVGYYETVGRTWERQALIKCRPIAGDRELGRAFLEIITPFVYQRYLSSTEIAEIRAMKRRIEQRTRSAGAEAWEVKTGRGGIRDVEFVVQFLQLLHGGQDATVRHHNTLFALDKLEKAGCLQAEERGIMEDTYRFLRKVEHRLQTMFDRQTHEMPRDPEEIRTLALRMGFAPLDPNEPRETHAQRFLNEYRDKTERNRRILNHFLHEAFKDDAAEAHPIVDLVFDPEPSPEQIAFALKDYRFQDHQRAYRNLELLAHENIPLLAQARCRHFLAAIAPRLLDAIAKTPDPDLALTNLEKVSASLGAKAVLWELMSFHQPSLRLYVELCATSQFLSEVLINNPGMIDDLLDSLVDDRPHDDEEIRQELDALCQGAEDLGLILLGFRNKEWVRIGSRDILGREPIQLVTRELADVAQSIVEHVAHDQWRMMSAQAAGGSGGGSGGGELGFPVGADGTPPWVIIAQGKLGGRELSYHGDLDLTFLYDETVMPPAGNPTRWEPLYAAFAQRVMRALGGGAQRAPLYQVDTRLRPFGTAGALVQSLGAFEAYHNGGAGKLWEVLALTRARVIAGGAGFAHRVQDRLRAILTRKRERNDVLQAVRWLRDKIYEEPHARTQRKRGIFEDRFIEFFAQACQLIHADKHPVILHTNQWDALNALDAAGLIPHEAHEQLIAAYTFVRSLRARLCLMHNRSDHELPQDPKLLAHLASACLTPGETSKPRDNPAVPPLRSAAQTPASPELDLDLGIGVEPEALRARLEETLARHVTTAHTWLETLLS